VNTGSQNGAKSSDVRLMGLFDELLKVGVKDVLNRETATEYVELEGEVLVALHKQLMRDVFEHSLQELSH